MGGVCASCGGEQKCLQSFDGGSLKQTEAPERQDVSLRIILKWIFFKKKKTGWPHKEFI